MTIIVIILLLILLLLLNPKAALGLKIHSKVVNQGIF